MLNNRPDELTTAHLLAKTLYTYDSSSYWAAFGAIYTEILGGEKSNEHLLTLGSLAGSEVVHALTKNVAKNA